MGGHMKKTEHRIVNESSHADLLLGGDDG